MVISCNLIRSSVNVILNIKEYSSDGIILPSRIMEIYFGLLSNSEETGLKRDSYKVDMQLYWKYWNTLLSSFYIKQLKKFVYAKKKIHFFSAFAYFSNKENGIWKTELVQSGHMVSYESPRFCNCKWSCFIWFICCCSCSRSSRQYKWLVAWFRIHIGSTMRTRPQRLNDWTDVRT